MNLANLINSGRMPLDSLQYKLMCTSVRSHLVQRAQPEILLRLPEYEVEVTREEAVQMHPYLNDEKVMTMLTGAPTVRKHKKTKTSKIMPGNP